jgi:apolipoprotein N-acyltransferase
MVVLAPPIGFELSRQMAGFSFSSTLRGSALVVGALIGMALAIWIAWAMRDFLSRQPFGRVLMILTILLALTYLVFPRSFTYVEHQGAPSTQRP